MPHNQVRACRWQWKEQFIQHLRGDITGKGVMEGWETFLSLPHGIPMLSRAFLDTGQVKIEQLPERKATVAILVESQGHPYRIQKGNGKAFEAFIGFRSLRNPNWRHFGERNTEVVPPGFERFNLRLGVFLEIEEKLLAFASRGKLIRDV